MAKIELTEAQVLDMINYITLSSILLEEEMEDYKRKLQERNISGSPLSPATKEALGRLIENRSTALACAKEVQEKLYKA